MYNTAPILREDFPSVNFIILLHISSDVFRVMLPFRQSIRNEFEYSNSSIKSTLLGVCGSFQGGMVVKFFFMQTTFRISG